MSNQVVFPGVDYLALPRAPETWLVEGLLPTSGGLLCFGDAKVGKSFAILQLACSLATGQPWFDFAVPRAVKVVYLQLDTPRGLWADRIEKVRKTGHPVEAVHFADRETLNTWPFDIMDPAHFLLLRDTLVAAKAEVVVVDTIREAHSGDENDSTVMRNVITRLEACVKPAAMVLVAHSRKPFGEDGPNLMADNRGSNYVVGKMDAICRFFKTSMRFTSRTLEEQSIKLDRNDDGTWAVVEDSFKADAEMVILANKGATTRELARILHERTGKSEDACRSWLRRHAAH